MSIMLLIPAIFAAVSLDKIGDQLKRIADAMHGKIEKKEDGFW